ncbi:MAG TPA: PEGA domain-containing protein [Candidatus Eisenbacteria bacterium]|nr:PEGA domain-containing protein [Candidatus Eisenbacteria bacterium]
MVCPLIVLYALGYAGIPNEGVIKTGLVSVATAPPGASVLVGGAPYPQKTPTFVRNLPPGRYPVTLQLKGHRSWSSSVEVEEEKATVLENVLLVPAEPETERLAEGPFQELAATGDAPFLLARSGPRAGEAVVLDWRTGRTRPLLPPGSVFLSNRIEFWEPVPESPYLFLALKGEDRRLCVRAKLGRGPHEIEDLSHLFPERFAHLQWDPADRDELFFAEDGFLSRVNVKSSAVYPKFAEGVRGYGLAGRKVYVVDGLGRVTRMDRDGTNAELVSEEPLLASYLARNKAFYRILVLDREKMLFWSEKGPLLAAGISYPLAEGGVEEVVPYVSGGKSKALVRERHRIGAVDFSGELPWLTWLGRGRELVRAVWAHGGSHVLFQDGRKVFLLEADVPVKAHLEELLEVKEGSAFAFVEETGKIYYLDRAGALVSWRLAPPRPSLLGRGAEGQPEGAAEP